ncbi:hypothetical protein KEM56_006454 [Ascosphaera pollenicola]|nr:hypothetical protein KEM56_006454 [Ascosphaera pollenicola]
MSPGYGAGAGGANPTSSTHSNSYDSHRSKASSVRDRGDHSQIYSPVPTSASARLGPISPSPLGISGPGINSSQTSFQSPFPRSASPAPMGGGGAGSGSSSVMSPSRSQHSYDFAPVPRTQSPAPMHPPSRLGTPSGARSQSPAFSSSGYRRPGTAASNNSNANAMAMATTSATAAPLSTPTTVWEYTHPHAHGIHVQSQALALQTQGLTSRIPSSGSSGQPGKMEHGPNSSSPVTPVAGYAAPQPIRRGTGSTLPAREEGMSLAMGGQSPASMRRPGPGPGPPPPVRKDSPGPASAPGSAAVPNWLGAPGPVFRERGEDDTEEVTEIEDDAHHNEEEEAQRAERRSKRESAPPVASFSAAIAMLRRESPTRSQSGPITTVKQLDEENQKRGDTYGPPAAADQQPSRDRGRPRTKSQQRLSVVQEQKQLPSPMAAEPDTVTLAGQMSSRLPAGEEGEIIRARSRSPSRRPPTHRQRSERGMPVGPADPHQARSARTEDSNQPSSSKQRSQSKRNAKSPGSHRICRKCGQTLQGQFVRALDRTYHLECFQCFDCGEIVASKFFTMAVPEANGDQVPLCETDYFRRLDLLCYSCNSALRGSYITALNHKYHIEHFTCSTCPTVFGSQDSYYEYNGQVYCHYHYFTKFAQRCNGCQSAILKQFVEIFRNGQNQHWHPECYMIHKFWNVRLAAASAISVPREQERPQIDEPDAEQKDGEDGEKDPDFEGEAGKVDPKYANISNEERRTVREQEEAMERKVFTIWSTLSTFEESSAACISDMLLHVSSGSYIDGVVVAKRFIYHVELLFRALDGLNKSVIDIGLKEISYGREAKLLCKKIVAFFSLLSKSSEQGVRRLGVTPDLLKLVTGLAHYLKLLIRIGLQGALRFEREFGEPTQLYAFLGTIDHLGSASEITTYALLNSMNGLSDQQSDRCTTCSAPVDDECILLGHGPHRWHVNPKHFVCCECNRDLTHDLDNARWLERAGNLLCRECLDMHEDKDAVLTCQYDFSHVTRLQQYVFLLQVALARLLAVLKASGCLPQSAVLGGDCASFDATMFWALDLAGIIRILPIRSIFNYICTAVIKVVNVVLCIDDINVRERDADSEGAGFGSRTPRRANTTHTKPTSHQQSMASSTSGMQGSSSLEQTVGEIRRLHSKRTERAQRTLSTTVKTPRASRIINTPKGRSARPGSPSADSTAGSAPEKFSIVEERAGNAHELGRRSDIVFPDNGLNLDDISRIACVQQKIADSAEQGHRSITGHHADGSVWLNQGSADDTPRQRPKYFFELSQSEYYVARHLAVLQMHPLLENQMTLEELVALIEPRKTNNIWTFFGRAFKNDRSRATKKKGVFGVPLDQLIEKDGTDSTHGVIGSPHLKVPTFIDDVVSAMRQMDMSVEGVFRKNGNIKKLKEASEIINSGCENPDLNRETPVQVAALLKKFLREMPEPLLTYKLYKLFLASQNLPDEDTKRHVLHLTCCLLPKPHRDTIEVLFNFLNWAATFSQIDEESGSKMDVHNLATVIAPGVLRPDDGKLPAGSSATTYGTGKNVSVKDGLLAIEAVASLIEDVDTMAEVPRDIANLLNDKSFVSTVSSMSSADIIKKYGGMGGIIKPSSHAAQNPDLPPVAENDNQDRNGSTGNTQQNTNTSRVPSEGLPVPPKAVAKGGPDLQDVHGPRNASRGQPQPGRDDRRTRREDGGPLHREPSQGPSGSSQNGPSQGGRHIHQPAPAHMHNFSQPGPHSAVPGGRSYAAYQPYSPSGPNAPPAVPGQRPKPNPHPQSVSTNALPKPSHPREQERDRGLGPGPSSRSLRDVSGDRSQKQRGPSGSRSKRPGTASSAQNPNGTVSDWEGPESSTTN